MSVIFPQPTSALAKPLEIERSGFPTIGVDASTFQNFKATLLERAARTFALDSASSSKYSFVVIFAWSVLSNFFASGDE